jgi:hypothetical protein
MAVQLQFEFPNFELWHAGTACDHLGDVVRLRKAHPCGSYEWEVVRVGADIGLKCLKCQRRVLLERGVFERRLKEFVSKSN